MHAVSGFEGTVSSRHAGWLGTVIEITSRATSADVSDAAHRTVMNEVARLQNVFDAFDPASNLRRWLDGTEAPLPELVEVLDLAETWRSQGGGAFDPAAVAFTKLWTSAAADDALPTNEVLAAVVTSIATARRPRPPTWAPPDVPYELNALAKGWIVDRAVDAAWSTEGLRALTVNAGGDLVHRGPAPIVVGIEDPARPYDNVAPLLAVRLQDGAIATSGSARRGWKVAGRWYPHVIDPRSGRPVDHHASVSVVADDAVTADVLATIIGVLVTDEALTFAEEQRVACCIVGSDRAVHRSAAWVPLELTPGS